MAVPVSERLDVSLRAERARRRDAWAQWVAQLRPWHLFGALTFDQRRPRGPRPPGPGTGRLRLAPRLSEDGSVRLSDVPLTADVARTRVRAWLRDGEEVVGRRLSAVVALEYQKSGWPHFHPLLGVDGGLQGGEIAALGQLWFRRNGYAKLEVPRVIGDVAAYASKYLTKELEVGDVVVWPRRGPLSAFEGQLRMRGG